LRRERRGREGGRVESGGKVVVRWEQVSHRVRRGDIGGVILKDGGERR